MILGHKGNSEKVAKKEANEKRMSSSLFSLILHISCFIKKPTKQTKGYIANASPKTLLPNSKYFNISRTIVKKITNQPKKYRKTTCQTSEYIKIANLCLPTKGYRV